MAEPRSAAAAPDDPDPAAPVGRGRSVLRRVGGIGTLLAAVALVVALLLAGGGDGHRYRLTFQTAGQVVEENEVKIGGQTVGSVEEVSLGDDGLATIEVSLDRELHEGSTAVVRLEGLSGVANRYVSISPGPDSEPVLPDGSTIGLRDTTTVVDIDQLFNAFDERAREGLTDFVRGQGDVYAGRGAEANRSYKYVDPALGQTNLTLEEVNADQRAFEQFLVSSSRMLTALSEREDELASSLSATDAAFSAIASENRAFSSSLQRLAPNFRQSNTTFANLRDALDDLDSLVATAKPATRDLAPFLRELRPVLTDAVPLFSDLRDVVDRSGAANDAGELVQLLPRVDRAAGPGFRNARRAIADFQPTLSFARPYAPDMLNALAKLGQVTGYYDANGHYARVRPAGINIFEYDTGTSVLDPLPIADQYDPFGSPTVPIPCPGAATQASVDGSNPFVGPVWPESGLDSSDCDPTDLPPGP